MFYCYDMARMLKGLLSELLFGNVGMEIPTYVRNDNSTVLHQVDSPSTVTDEKRLNDFPGSNREELGRNNWLSIGYIPWRLNTSDGLTKSIPIVALKRLINGNISQIVTESQKRGH